MTVKKIAESEIIEMFMSQIRYYKDKIRLNHAINRSLTIDESARAIFS